MMADGLFQVSSVDASMVLLFGRGSMEVVSVMIFVWFSFLCFTFFQFLMHGEIL